MSCRFGTKKQSVQNIENISLTNSDFFYIFKDTQTFLRDHKESIPKTTHLILKLSSYCLYNRTFFSFFQSKRNCKTVSRTDNQIVVTKRFPQKRREETFFSRRRRCGVHTRATRTLLHTVFFYPYRTQFSRCKFGLDRINNQQISILLLSRTKRERYRQRLLICVLVSKVSPTDRRVCRGVSYRTQLRRGNWSQTGSRNPTEWI